MFFSMGQERIAYDIYIINIVMYYMIFKAHAKVLDKFVILSIPPVTCMYVIGGVKSESVAADTFPLSLHVHLYMYVPIH
jgi:hypothetical protein